MDWLRRFLTLESGIPSHDTLGRLFGLLDRQEFEQCFRRCWAFTQLECLSCPEQWPDLKMFGVIVSERTVNGQTSREQRLYIGSIAPDAKLLMRAVRAHWEIENSLHWCLDVAMNDDQMRARAKNAGANLAILRRLILNLFRANPVKGKKVGIHTRRIIAASSPDDRAKLLGLKGI